MHQIHNRRQHHLRQEACLSRSQMPKWCTASCKMALMCLCETKRHRHEQQAQSWPSRRAPCTASHRMHAILWPRTLLAGEMYHIPRPAHARACLACVDVHIADISRYLGISRLHLSIQALRLGLHVRGMVSADGNEHQLYCSRCAQCPYAASIFTTPKCQQQQGWQW